MPRKGRKTQQVRVGQFFFINYIYTAEGEYWVWKESKVAAEKENKRLFTHSSHSRKAIEMSAELIIKCHLHNENTTPPPYMMTLRRAGKNGV